MCENPTCAVWQETGARHLNFQPTNTSHLACPRILARAKIPAPAEVPARARIVGLVPWRRRGVCTRRLSFSQIYVVSASVRFLHMPSVLHPRRFLHARDLYDFRRRHLRARTNAHATFLRVQEVRMCGFSYGKSAFQDFTGRLARVNFLRLQKGILMCENSARAEFARARIWHGMCRGRVCEKPACAEFACAEIKHVRALAHTTSRATSE
jgi:hypothetical protein